ncbi:MAG: site-specific integrase [Bacteroidales bacterium]|nr:site-specific integrase [Bacteroidales bacterium]
MPEKQKKKIETPLGNLLATRVFINVPVKLDPALHTDEDRQAAAILQRRLERDIQREAPESVFSVDFSSDIWDFRPLYPGGPAERQRLNYSNLATPRLKRFVKFFMRFLYEEQMAKPSTLYNYLFRLQRITTFIIKDSQSAHDDIDLITTEDIFAACTQKKLTSLDEDMKNSTRSGYFGICLSFWRYCIENCGMPFPVSLTALENWYKNYSVLTELEDNRIPDIPEEYYQAVLAKSLEVIRAEPKKYRYSDVLVAAVQVILSQTGMRISDVLSLKVDDLKEVEVEGIGVKTAILEFSSSKPTKGHNEPLRFQIYASELCVEAFKRLLKLRRVRAGATESDMLILNRSEANINAYTYKSYHELVAPFYERHLAQYCFRPWPGIKSHFSQTNKKGTERPRVFTPTTHQFRVHLCSYLYRKGVNIIIIEKHLAHLSLVMYGYYIRMADNRDKLAGFAEQFINDYIRRGYTVSEPAGAKVQASVLRFLAEKNITVNSSSDEILKALKGAVTVRQKGVGYCVRASFVPCNEEPEGNRLLCTFGMCPNYVTMFHAADATLTVFRDHVSACNLNLAAGHFNAAAKELCDAKMTAERHLLPQLKALEKEYNAIGWDEILKRHPHLEEIVFNLSEIKREVAEVMEMEVTKPTK